jgi:thermolysin
VFVVPSSRLVVAAEDGTVPRLAYEVFVRAERGAPFHTRYLVDAQSGVIFDELDNLMAIEATAPGVRGGSQKFEVTQQGTGYVMVDTTRTPNGIRTFTANNTQTLPGNLVASNSLTQWNPAGVDAHAHAINVYDYYKKTFNRLGLNGNNGPMVSTVNFDVQYNNAFWDGTQMAYGDGDGRVFHPLSAGLDVVAHEFTHGVITSTSNLVYRNMSGALNESVADIFGMLIEHEYKPGDGNFIMGETISADGRTMRDMKTPSRGQQPAHMNQFVRTTQNNGGVHINSGIPNNAAYLMTVGGTNPVSNVQVPVGLGWEKTAQLWYRANSTYFSTNTDFAGAARGTQSAAQDLQFTDNEKAIVECAWIAVGVVTGTCKPISATPPPGTGTGSGTTTGTTTDSTTGGTTSDPAPTPTEPAPADEPTADPPEDNDSTSGSKRRVRKRSSALNDYDDGAGVGCSVGSSPSSSAPLGWALLVGTAVVALVPRRPRRRSPGGSARQRPSR